MLPVARIGAKVVFGQNTPLHKGAIRNVERFRHAGCGFSDRCSTASESDNVHGAVFAGRRYAKPRAEVVLEQLGEFSRVSMTEAEIKKAVLEIDQKK